ncbi:MAG: nicotinate phosphoribosyltransferase [Pseudomonadota bacterium]
MPTSTIYRQSLTLLADLYEITMAYGYWKLGRAHDEAAFNLFFRRNPFNGGYAIAAGLEYVVDYLGDLNFSESDVEYLASLVGSDGEPLFEAAFLDYLGNLEFKIDVDAVPEGTVVFPHQPLVRVRGPIMQCQIIESALLNMVNFQTLIATKAARVCHAARHNGVREQVLEFGLRRAQGVDGAIAASRAAYVGGCAATSNVLAGKLFDIPVRGTHAHSWVMSFDDELESFEAYAQAMPNNCVFLVDTYDTMEGVRNACIVGRKLRELGREMVGVRLDSGDLAYLSIKAREILNEEGFPDAAIVASNELDEYIISSLKDQGATISARGVGTKLSTAFDQPALGGVYKLSAVRPPGQSWQFKVKVSEQTLKVSTPGCLKVRRYFGQDGFLADMTYEESLGVPEFPVVVDPTDHTHRKAIPRETPYEELLVPVQREGQIVYEPPSVHAVRDRTMAQLDSLHGSIKRHVNPHRYPAGLELGLHDLKTALILDARSRRTSDSFGADD